jgi:hypothetical protein
MKATKKTEKEERSDTMLTKEKNTQENTSNIESQPETTTDIEKQTETSTNIEEQTETTTAEQLPEMDIKEKSGVKTGRQSETTSDVQPERAPCEHPEATIEIQDESTNDENPGKNGPFTGASNNITWDVDEIDDTTRILVERMIEDLREEMSKGEISRQMMESILHAINYERDIAQAGHDGEVRGRNARIEEFLNTQQEGDGIHQFGQTVVRPSQPIPYSVIGGLSTADKMTIWERGNEKRVKY